MSGVSRRYSPRTVVLDCGCEVFRPERTPGETMTSGSTLVRCSGHGLRHEVAVADVEVVVTYSAKRLDPPDPDPEHEEEAADA